MAKKKLTPMLEQYFAIKKKNPEAFLFFRLGDFYEMFEDDAREAAKLLGLTLTARHKGKENEVAMCGVPHHSAEKYIAQLSKLGKRVAICDQVSDPNLPGIVEREVVKIITPGTTLDETITDTKKNNYLISLVNSKAVFGLSLMDLATGEFKVTEVQSVKALQNLLFLLDPVEVIVDSKSDFREISNDLENRSSLEYQLPYFEDPQNYLLNHFQVSTLSGFGVDHLKVGIQAAAALLSYVKETQKTDLQHIKKLTCYQFNDVMILDEATIRNLELLHTVRDFRFEGSLLQVIDKTLTRMGARKIRKWLLSPLTNIEKLNERLEAVTELLAKNEVRQDLQRELKEFYDLERLVGRIGCRTANARDLNYLKVNLLKIPAIKLVIKDNSSEKLNNIHSNFNDLHELVQLLEERLLEEAPVTITEGNLIADGYNEELDELRKIMKNGNDWLIEYQQKLRDETKIHNLKVKFNKVFGYHIEVTKSHKDKVPDYFQAKQTLVNADRYMTSELKEFEEKYLSAEEKIKTLEHELFQQTLEEVLPYIEAIQNNADLVAILDVLQSLAQLAFKENYCRPLLHSDINLEIKEGRHPVIEKMLKKQNENYIANDTFLDQEQKIVLLTGPNMAGKSSYLRQVALIVLLAHIGSFVPASSAKIGITDRIFTRVGAADDISTGQSTFMVEMTEAASIINNATERSLIIFDELGRGTSTYDGVSIAWAILEHVAQEVKAMTLFATHYHELIDVVKEMPQAKNYSIAVSEKDGEVVFLRKIIDQGVDRSYGIEVAKLAGLPNSVINRAKQILTELEKDRLQEEQILMGNQPSLFESSLSDPLTPRALEEQSPQRKIISELKEKNINDMTPVEALNYLNNLKKKIND